MMNSLANRFTCAGFGMLLGGLSVATSASAQQDAFCDTLFQTAHSINQCLGWRTYLDSCPDHSLVGMGEVLRDAVCTAPDTSDTVATAPDARGLAEPAPPTETEQAFVTAPSNGTAQEPFEASVQRSFFSEGAILDLGGIVLAALDADTADALELDVTSGLYVLAWDGTEASRLEGQVLQTMNGYAIKSPRAYRSLVLEAHRGGT